MPPHRCRHCAFTCIRCRYLQGHVWRLVLRWRVSLYMHGDLVRVHVQHCRWHSRSIRHEHGRHTLFPCDQSDAQRHRRPSRHAWCIFGGSSGRLCLCLAALMQCRSRRKPTCEWRGRRPCPTGTPHDRAHRRRYRQHPRFSYAAGTAIVGAGRFKWDNVQLQQQSFAARSL